MQLTVVQQVADHFLAASADRVVQECATMVIPVHEVAPSSVQLLELRAGAGLGSWPTFLAPGMSPNLHPGHRADTGMLTHMAP